MGDNRRDQDADDTEAVVTGSAVDSQGGPTESRCGICKSPIYVGARKCIECGSYQHPVRRFLAGMDVKSLVAIIPIATLAFVFIKDQVTTPRAELRIASLACTDDKIKVAAANIGERDALFAGVNLIQVGKSPIKLQVEAPSKTDLLIEPGKTHIYELAARDSQGITLGLSFSDDSPCQYRLRARTLAFEDPSNDSAEVCACPGK